MKKEHETGKPHCDGYLSKKDFNRFVDRIQCRGMLRNCYPTKQCAKQAAQLYIAYFRYTFSGIIKNMMSATLSENLRVRFGGAPLYYCRGKYGVYEERIINNHGMVVYEALSY